MPIFFRAKFRQIYLFPKYPFPQVPICPKYLFSPIANFPQVPIYFGAHLPFVPLPICPKCAFTPNFPNAHLPRCPFAIDLLPIISSNPHLLQWLFPPNVYLPKVPIYSGADMPWCPFPPNAHLPQVPNAVSKRHFFKRHLSNANSPNAISKRHLKRHFHAVKWCHLYYEVAPLPSLKWCHFTPSSSATSHSSGATYWSHCCRNCQRLCLAVARAGDSFLHDEFNLWLEAIALNIFTR